VPFYGAGLTISNRSPADSLVIGTAAMPQRACLSQSPGGRTLKWLKVKQAKYREEERGLYKP
jgi:hypothetical protein